MKNWTLCLDESGRFEGAGGENERNAFVIGGVLCPGTAEELDGALRGSLRNACASMGIAMPPHATELGAEQLLFLQSTSRRLVSEVDGIWFAVVARAEGGLAKPSLGRYLRMLGGALDLAVRLVALRGGERLDLCPATRSVPLGEEDLERAARQAIAQRSEDRGRARFAIDVEVRGAVDALGREGAGLLPRRPSVGEVRARSAQSPAAHPGIVLADVLCNRLYGAARDLPDESLAHALGPLIDDRRPGHLIVAKQSLTDLREMDRALRDDPPDLVRAARRLAAVDGQLAARRSGTHGLQWACEGTAAVARDLWDRAIAVLGDAPDAALRPLPVALLGGVDAVLAARGGSYEGTWSALRDAWSGSTKLAGRLVAKAPPELGVRLWRAVMECANHRGDVAQAEAALAAAEGIFARGATLALLAERLYVRNLDHVTLQNRLPARDTDEADGLRARLEGSARALRESVDEAGALLALAGPTRTANDPPALPAEFAVLAEEDLSDTEVLDLDRGRAYGSIARTYAFLGHCDEALRLALRARRHFVDSPSDLAFNATVIARIELERGRLGAGDARVASALRLASADSLDPREMSALCRAIGETPALRFTLDLVARSLAWSLGPAELAPRWLRELGRDDELFALLSTGEMRSHPTELVARHLGEFLLRSGRAPESRAWFQLSMEVCAEAPDDRTLRRFAPFTERLSRQVGFAGEGPALQMQNPTFEYR